MIAAIDAGPAPGGRVPRPGRRADARRRRTPPSTARSRAAGARRGGGRVRARHGAAAAAGRPVRHRGLPGPARRRGGARLGPDGAAPAARGDGEHRPGRRRRPPAARSTWPRRCCWSTGWGRPSRRPCSTSTARARPATAAAARRPVAPWRSTTRRYGPAATATCRSASGSGSGWSPPTRPSARSLRAGVSRQPVSAAPPVPDRRVCEDDGMAYDASALPDVSGLTVGILGGTGDQGRGLAYRLARAGQTVLIGSRSAERAARGRRRDRRAARRTGRRQRLRRRQRRGGPPQRRRHRRGAVGRARRHRRARCASRWPARSSSTASTRSASTSRAPTRCASPEGSAVAAGRRAAARLPGLRRVPPRQRAAAGRPGGRPDRPRRAGPRRGPGGLVGIVQRAGRPDPRHARHLRRPAAQRRTRSRRSPPT